MNARNLFVILIVLYLGFTSAFAEENDISALNQRVIRLEGQKELLDGQKKNLEDTYNTKLGILDRQLEQNKKEVSDKIVDMESYRKTLDEKLVLEFQKTDFRMSKMEWILGGFLGLMTLSGLIGWFKLTQKIREIAEEKAEKIFEEKFKNRIEQLFQDHKNEIIRVVGEDVHLKSNKSIVVVSKPGADEKFLRHFFEEMKFAKKEFETFDPSQKHDDKDLILLNNNDLCQKFDKTEIEQFAQNIDPKKILFYFGPNIGISFPDNSNFANSKMQLYGNLMNALRYQKML